MRAWWLGLLLAAGCRKAPDASATALAQAKQRHLELVTKGERPDSKAFDEVLTLLEQVPAEDARRAEAEKLSQAIRNARVRVRRPLATVHASERDLPDDIRLQTRACAALAEALARDGGTGPSMLRALDECRRRVERLEKAYHDAHEPPADDVSQRLNVLLDAGVR